MTVGAYTPNSYAATGVASSYAYGFRVLDQTHLLVTLNGVTLALTTDYTVDGVGSTNGGNIYPVTPGAFVGTLVIASAVPYTRTTDFQDDFRPQTFNDDQDRQSMQIRQLAEATQRALALPLGTPGVSGTLPIPGAGKFFRYNALGTGIEVVDLAATLGSIAASAFGQSLVLAADAQSARTLLTALSINFDERIVSLSGTDNYTGNASPVIAAYPQAIWLFKFPNANTSTTVNVNLNSIGNKRVKDRDGSDPAVGGIKANSWHLARFDGTNFVLMTLIAVPSTTLNDLLLYQDQKASGTAGNGYTAGAWRTVILNTEVTDTANIGSLAANAITLQAGSYEFEAFVNPGTTGASNTTNRCRLQNTSDATTVVQGVNVKQPGSGFEGQTHAIVGSFTIASAKTFELQIYPANTTTGEAGVASGDAEIYASIKLRRYA